MTTDAVSKTGATTTTTTTTTTKPEKRLEVMAGDTLDDINRLGSQGQKIAAPLFSYLDWGADTDHKHIFDEFEAKLFNCYNFKSEPGKITMYNKDDGRIIEIKYDQTSLSELQKKEYNYVNDRFGSVNLSWGNYINEEGHERIKHSVASLGNYAKLSIDTVNNTVTVIGGDGNLYTMGMENVTLQDCSMDEIHSTNDKNITLKNVKNEGLLFDSATKVEATRGTNVRYDEASKVEIEYTK